MKLKVLQASNRLEFIRFMIVSVYQLHIDKLNYG